jgi:hypothetical protein
MALQRQKRSHHEGHPVCTAVVRIPPYQCIKKYQENFAKSNCQFRAKMENFLHPSFRDEKIKLSLANCGLSIRT